MEHLSGGARYGNRRSPRQANKRAPTQLGRLALRAELKFAERLSNRLGGGSYFRYAAMPPSLVKLLSQDIRLDSTIASQRLGIHWLPFEEGVADSAKWFNSLA